MRDILSVNNPEQFIEFEKRVELDHMSFIDAYIPSTMTIIEQKSYSVNLDKSLPQSDGLTLTPFQQAKHYSDWLPYSEHARWIFLCNFEQFLIDYMEHPKAQPETVLLSDLAKDWHKLSFLVDVNAVSP